MENEIKTFVAGIGVILLSVSCCWMSSLAVWLGGAAFLSTIVVIIEDQRVILFVLGALLVGVSIYLYWRRGSESSN